MLLTPKNRLFNLLQVQARKVGIVGPGMITLDQILPSYIQMWRKSMVGEILISGQGTQTLSNLLSDEGLHKIFPDFEFKNVRTFPALNASAAEHSSNNYVKMFNEMSPGDIVVVAVPDHLHTGIILDAIERGFHVICVKSLCTNYEEALRIQQAAEKKGVAVFIDFHKFADPYVLGARKLIRDGKFGTIFLGGRATMMEADLYFRESNFPRWFLRETADPATYVACHYIDQLWMWLGLMPNRVYVTCMPDQFPTGEKCFSWSTTTLEYPGGASFVVQNSLLQPAHGPTGNHQGIALWFRDASGHGSYLQHDDHHRGRTYVYSPDSVPNGGRLIWGGSQYMQVIDRMDGWNGSEIAGYGYDSFRILTEHCLTMASMGTADKRNQYFSELSSGNVVPTVRNRSWLALLYSAMRKSIETRMPVDIDYESAKIEVANAIVVNFGAPAMFPSFVPGAVVPTC